MEVVKMKRTVMAFVLAAVLALSLGTVAFAGANPDNPRLGQRGDRVCQGSFSQGFMRDEDGRLLDVDAFAQRVDQAIQDGLIDEGDRQRLIEIHQWCLENGRSGNIGRGSGRWRNADGTGFGGRGAATGFG